MPLIPYISMVDVPHKMVGLERMLDYRGVGLERFHCTNFAFQHSSSKNVTVKILKNLVLYRVQIH